MDLSINSSKKKVFRTISFFYYTTRLRDFKIIYFKILYFKILYFSIDFALLARVALLANYECRRIPN